MTRKSILTIALALISVVGSAVAADEPEDAAQSAAEAWLKVVDAGDYGESWDQAAKVFKAALSQADWVKTSGGVRTPLGKVVSRKLKSREYTEKLPGAPDGKYVVIQYDTVFEKRPQAIETVIPMLDPDGSWRVSGYFIR
jgi:opacity protein-like surface antigen